MIGQRELWARIEHQIRNDKFPRFAIFIGECGSGKKTLAKKVAKTLNGSSVITDTKVDSIREIIDAAYTIVDTTVYIIPDADTMSGASANALLKVTEEPPHDAYFILTCESLDNLLPTIRSRGVTYMMEPYSYEDKCDYIDYQSSKNQRYVYDEADEEFILEVASTIGEVEFFLSALDKDAQAINDFRAYVNLVIDNIAEVSGSNAFKIADKIAFKNEDNKYDLRLFWKAFRSGCIDKMRGDDPLKYARAVAITGDSLSQLSIKGLNKQMLFDTWLLDIRSEWL